MDEFRRDCMRQRVADLVPVVALVVTCLAAFAALVLLGLFD
jgi:hypothetical protein